MITAIIIIIAIIYNYNNNNSNNNNNNITRLYYIEFNIRHPYIIIFYFGKSDVIFKSLHVLFLLVMICW